MTRYRSRHAAANMLWYNGITSAQLPLDVLQGGLSSQEGVCSPKKNRHTTTPHRPAEHGDCHLHEWQLGTAPIPA